MSWMIMDVINAYFFGVFGQAVFSRIVAAVAIGYGRSQGISSESLLAQNRGGGGCFRQFAGEPRTVWGTFWIGAKFQDLRNQTCCDCLALYGSPAFSFSRVIFEYDGLKANSSTRNSLVKLHSCLKSLQKGLEMVGPSEV